MDYKEKILQKDEVLIIKATMHLIVFFPSVAAFFLAILAYLLIQHVIVFFIPFAIFLYSLLKFLSTCFMMTNKRIIGTTALFKTKIYEAPLQEIDSIVIHDSYFGKIFDYQTLVLTTSSGVCKLTQIASFNTKYKNVLDELNKSSKRRKK